MRSRFPVIRATLKSTVDRRAEPFYDVDAFFSETPQALHLEFLRWGLRQVSYAVVFLVF